MAAPLDVLVERAAAGMGALLDPRSRNDVCTWLQRLQEWNARIDLTAARSPEELVDVMLADALVVSTQIPTASRVVDVGTGAGAPGMALALLRRDLRVTLVEPLGKRVSFLRTVIGTLGRTDVMLERSRGEVIADRRDWEVALSRATLAPEAWLDLGTRLAVPGGLVCVLLAKDTPPVHPYAVLESERAYTWPLTGAERRIAIYRV